MTYKDRTKTLSISYVVPTLNSAATLDMTLYSLRSQKDVEVNIIVVDSGSTDETLDICKRWDVKTLYAEPGNMYRAINVGLRECNTEWLGYINSDDWLYPDSLSRLIALGNSLNADIVYGNCDYTDEFGRFLYSFAATPPNQLASLFKMRIFGFAQPAAIFRGDIYSKLQGFNEKYFLSADADFYLRAFQADFQFSLLPGQTVACFRLHSNQLSQTKAKAMQDEIQKIFDINKNFSLEDLAVFVKWRFRNIPHYLIRLLRQSLLCGTIKITKSLSSMSYGNDFK
jgi:glycosyltransferase involved in cell wall biosynthesis